MIDLSEDQLQTIITNILNKEEGLNELLEMMLNGMMKLERGHWLQEHPHDSNKANGYRPGQAMGYGRKLSLHIPRDRMGRFKPVIWALLRDQNQQVRQLCFELYGKGLTTHQVGEITEKIYGQYYSSSAVSAFNQELAGQIQAWRERKLQSRYPVLYIDAIFAKVRRGQVSSEAFYVVLGLSESMQREVLAIENIPSESAGGWSDLLARLKERGVKQCELIVSDALPGLDEALARQFPRARHQQCVTHLKRQILRYVKSTDKETVAEELRQVFLTGQKNYTRQQARNKFEAFTSRWARLYPHIARMSANPQMDTYFTYLSFDWRVQAMIYTTNWIERLNKSFRRSLKIRNALPNPQAGLLLLGKVAIDMEDGPYQFPIYNFKFDRILYPHIS